MALLVISAVYVLSCAGNSGNAKSSSDEFYVDKDWIEVHFHRSMPTEKLVELRERLSQYGVQLKYLAIQRDTLKNITKFQIEVHDGRGSIARSTTEFLDEIPYGIRVKRDDPTSAHFKVGPLYKRRGE